MATPEGTRHIDIASSDRPPLWYQIGVVQAARSSWATMFPCVLRIRGIKEHAADWQCGVICWLEHLEREEADYHDNSITLVGQSWAVSLAESASTIEQRYVNTRRLIDGEVVLGRMPAYGLTQLDDERVSVSGPSMG
jgi:hypothetical protein